MITHHISKTSSLRMSGLSGFSVAVVEPQFALNVGYLARVMANFGLMQLYIISKEKKLLDKEQALRFSSHGYPLIEDVKYLQSVDQLRERFRILVGTTAIRGKRKSNITRKTFSLEQSIPIVRKAIEHEPAVTKKTASRAHPQVICFVFGRDTTGLTNEELRKCDYNITISSGTKYNTFNISHAAAILFFAFQNRMRAAQNFDTHREMEREPTRREKERVVTLFQELAEVSDYQDYKITKLIETISRLLDRSNPSLRELYLLMGLASKAKTRIKLLAPQLK
jgi:tRNA/rRNA methyltransferase